MTKNIDSKSKTNEMSLMPRILPVPSLCFPDARASTTYGCAMIVATRAATLIGEEAILQRL